MKNEFNFTKTDLLKLKPPRSAAETYRDTNEKGLSLYVTAKGIKTFFVRKRIAGRDERIIIGQFPDVTVEKARKAAQKIKGTIADGKDPNEHKKNLREEMTFKQLFDEYMERYSKKHKRSWKYDEREVEKFLSHWYSRKISKIEKKDIQHLIEKIYDQNGLYQANRILERIRAIYNKAIEWGWKGDNPTQGIKKYAEKARDRFIQPNELPFFFFAIQQEENDAAKDYILISLKTGARKSNVLAMRWEDVNWERKEWRIPETKNGEPVTIPLVRDAITILEERRRKTNGKWVFPGDGKSGHLADPKKTWNRIRFRATLLLWEQSLELKELIAQVDSKIKSKSNYAYTDTKLIQEVKKQAEKQGVYLPSGLLDIRLHDIRRTQGSYQAITGSSLQIIGRSLGHKSMQSTQIYARLHTDPVRESMERATQAMLNAGKNS